MRVRRDDAGELVELLPAGAPTGRRDRRVVHARRDRPPDRAGGARRAARAPRARARRRPRRGRGLAGRCASGRATLIAELATRRRRRRRRTRSRRRAALLDVARTTTTSRSSATASTSSSGGRRGPAARRRRAPASGILRQRAGASRRRGRFAKLPPRVRALAREPAPADAHEGQLAARPCTGPPTSTTSASSASTTTATSSASAASSACTRRPPTSARPSDIPVAAPQGRRRCCERAGFPPGSHDEKALVEILDTYPARRAVPDRRRTSSTRSRRGILGARRAPARAAVRAPRRATSASSRAWSSSRATASTPPTASAIAEILREAFGAETRRLGAAPDRVGARAHPLHRCAPAAGELPDVRRRRARGADRRGDALVGRRPARRAARGARRGARQRALPPLRRRRSRPATATTGWRARAVADVAAHRGAARRRRRSASASTGRSRRRRARCAASSTARGEPRARCPTCCRCSRHMGLTVDDERPYEVTPARRARRSGSTTSGCARAGATSSTPTRSASASTTAFARVWRGEAEDDGFNGLVLARRARLARGHGAARGRALPAPGRASPFSDALHGADAARAPATSRAALVELFHARFDPRATRDARRRRRGRARDRARRSTRSTSLDEDRILRSFLDRRAGDAAHELLPADATAAEAVPVVQARPARRSRCCRCRGRASRSSCYSPRVEGVHLRGGTVARGGLRWSDRREDFRTEVLGLMKAQMVKNARDRAGRREGRLRGQAARRGDRDALQAEVVACYRTFISGLLDITDNIVDGERRAAAATSCATTATTRTSSSPPTRARRRSPTSPTAIAAEYGFWLGDAFASGGSAGYDHKEMGITARGAWESVQRHFRELGVDVQTDGLHASSASATCRGDVFGNGMLLSQHIRLRGRVRPPPRLPRPRPRPGGVASPSGGGCSTLPRSSWADYDRDADLRGRRRVPAHARSRSRCRRRCARALGRRAPSALTPSELIQRDPARAGRPAVERRHRHLRQGARRDARRRRRQGQRRRARRRRRPARAASSARAATSASRSAGAIEYALAGGRVNTDAIDNAGGVELLRPRGQHQDPARRASWPTAT